MTVLAAAGLSKRFGGIQALDNVSVTFGAGQIHGLIGPNGSGKSTLLSILSGARAPDSGTIQVGGRTYTDLRSPRAARALGIERMPQELALVPGMSVADNLVLGAEPSRLGIVRATARRQRAAESLARVGLDLDPGTPVGTLRPSQQRLLMLARTLFRSADVVIADEPTAGLTDEDAHAVTAALVDVAAHGLGVIYVSHHLDEVARIAAQVTVLRDGRVVNRFGRSTHRDELLAELLQGDSVTLGREQHTPAEVLLDATGLAGGSLASADLVVRRHEVVGIAGLVGSGRDDLLPAITGERRRSGRVIAANREVRTPRTALRARVGYLPGDRTRAVVPSMDVGAHASLPVLGDFARGGIVSRTREHAAVSSALERVAVVARPSQPLVTLSGGNQQRALLARWFVADVDVLLIDEPAVGVDVAARADMLTELRKFAATGAVVVASSDVEDLIEICDRVLCFRGGRLRAEIRRHPGWARLISEAILYDDVRL